MQRSNKREEGLMGCEYFKRRQSSIGGLKASFTELLTIKHRGCSSSSLGTILLVMPGGGLARMKVGGGGREAIIRTMKQGQLNVQFSN